MHAFGVVVVVVAVAVADGLMRKRQVGR